MDKAEFDRFADEYHSMHAKNIAASGEAPDFFAEYKIRDIAEEIARRSGRCHSILDFGAGVGNSVPWVRKYFPTAATTCLDVSERSLEVAKQRFGHQEQFVHFDGKELPFDEPKFDLAYAMCVFHHIPHDQHVSLLAGIYRVLKPGGMLVVFEHNPYNPLTVKAVNTCEFDVNARLITAGSMNKACREAGFNQTDVRYRIFFPHALAVLRPMEKYMTFVPLGAQYSIFATKR